MIPWPETAHGRAVAEPEPVEAPSPGTPDASDPSVEIDTRPPETDAAPALPPMPPKRAVPQGKARIAPLSLAGALVFSAAVHAAVIAPLKVRDRVAGTVKLYRHDPSTVPSARHAARCPHMPCTPPPGGVEAEQRKTPGSGVS